ncbi:hypothetical protein STANM309S_00768 [Streptomyces tanashiensis]
MSFALLLTTAAATAVGAAALHAAHGLRKQVAALRTELAEGRALGASVPPQSRRRQPAEEIRAAVAEALAEERERELAAGARAFWAAQEARDAADAPSLLGGLPMLGEDAPFYLPRQADFAGLESLDLEAAEAMEELAELSERSVAEHEAADFAGEFMDLPEIADRPEDCRAGRGPPPPPLAPEPVVSVQTPVVTDHERTVSRLEELADLVAGVHRCAAGPAGRADV